MEDQTYLDQEELGNAPKQPVVIKYGLIMGLVVIVYTLALLYGNMVQNTAMSFISYIIYAAFLGLGMKEYRSSNHGTMTFGQGLGLGVLISVVASLLTGVFFYIYLAFVDDSLLANMLDAIMTTLEQNPAMTDEVLDMSLGIYEKMFTPIGYFFMSIFGGMLTGTIISLIMSAIMKRNPA